MSRPARGVPTFQYYSQRGIADQRESADLRRERSRCRWCCSCCSLPGFAVKIPDVAAPHLAARRAYRGADRGQRAARGRAAEDGRLRVDPHLPRTSSPMARCNSLPSLGIFAAINVLWGAGASMVQKDMKKMIAYSSVSHMGYVLLGVAAAAAVTSTGRRHRGLASFRQAALTGATLQMFTHGTITGMLFFCGRRASTTKRIPARSTSSAASRSACPGSRLLLHRLFCLARACRL